MSEKRQILWSLCKVRAEASTKAQFEKFIFDKDGRRFVNYGEMWLWSISELRIFWKAISEYFNMRFFKPLKTVLGINKMPGAAWFTG